MDSQSQCDRRADEPLGVATGLVREPLLLGCWPGNESKSRSWTWHNPAHSHYTSKRPKLLVEQIANLHIERLPEGVYLATSDDIPGLVAQGRTLTETLEIARDVARKLLEAQAERSGTAHLNPVGDSFDMPLVLGC